MQSCINAKANDMITLEIRLQNHSKIHRLAHVKKFAIMHHSLMIFLAFHDARWFYGAKLQAYLLVEQSNWNVTKNTKEENDNDSSQQRKNIWLMHTCQGEQKNREPFIFMYNVHGSRDCTAWQSRIGRITNPHVQKKRSWTRRRRSKRE